MTIAEKETQNTKHFTPFQREVAEMLKALGYTYRYYQIYQKDDLTDFINVGAVKDLTALFRIVYAAGEQDKVWEIQRMLGISPQT